MAAHSYFKIHKATRTREEKHLYCIVEKSRSGLNRTPCEFDMISTVPLGAHLDEHMLWRGKRATKKKMGMLLTL